jgi:hypothetical protein
MIAKEKVTYNGELFLAFGAVLEVANGWLRAIVGIKGLGQRVVHVVLRIIIVSVPIAFLSFLVFRFFLGFECRLGSLCKFSFFGGWFFLLRAFWLV